MRWILSRLRSSKPGPRPSSTRASVASTTSIAALRRRARTPWVPERPPSCSNPPAGVPTRCSNGARPNSSVVAAHRPMKKAMTGGSMVNAIQGGIPMSPSEELGQPYAARRHREADEAARGSQDEVLHRQLPHDLPPGGALCESYGELVRTLRRPCDQEVGDVGAGDEQDERHGAGQRQVGQLDVRAGGPVVERLHGRAGVLVRLGMLQPELPGDGAQLRLRLLETRAGMEAADSSQRADVTTVESLCGSTPPNSRRARRRASRSAMPARTWSATGRSTWSRSSRSSSPSSRSRRRSRWHHVIASRRRRSGG